MKILINREKYINNECPSLTKNIMDAYYSKLMVTVRNRIGFDKLRKIDTIDIRINQAFKYCSTIHFYTSINKKEEFHQTFPLNEISRCEDIGKKYAKLSPRYMWMQDFEVHGDINLGPNNSQKRIKMLWFYHDQKRLSSERVKNIRRLYESYLDLKEKFGYYEEKKQA